ncbi:MAG: hypothetical protein RG740_05040 [Acholeplasmataceae bacterium]|nr:hypothetical protein [Acholeplasmataceae bacterium]
MEESQRKAIFDLVNQKKQEITKQEPKDSETRSIIEDLHKAAILSEVQNNEEITTKFYEQARKTVDNELDSIHQENVSRRQKTTYDANKEACKNYGIDDTVPTWQVKMMRAGSAVWFVIYFIFATLTIAPLMVFFRGINTFIKNTYIVLLVAFLCYLLIVVGIPLIINRLG